MSRILLTWEMGGGYGHLVRLRAIAEPLLKKGHEVSIALHDPQLAPRYLDDLDLRWLPAPSFTPRPGKPLALKSFPEILLMQGFGDAESLYSRLRCWQGLYDSLDPELVIYDHSATAMLAFRGRPAKQFALGTGFFNPPRVSPYPLIRPWLKVETAQLERMEARVLDIANQAAKRAGATTMAQLHELFDIDGTALLTYPEIDHYEDRGDADYWGIPPNPKGEAVAWPAGDGPKIFGYLKPFKTLPALLGQLKARGAPCVIHLPKVPPKLAESLEGSCVRVTDKPVDIEQAAAEADVCICNGGHGTVATMLLAGKPMLILPQHLEQLIMAKRLSTIGACTVAPKLKERGMQAGLSALIEDPKFKAAAETFASAHKRNTAASFSKRVLGLAADL